MAKVAKWYFSASTCVGLVYLLRQHPMNGPVAISSWKSMPSCPNHEFERVRKWESSKIICRAWCSNQVFLCFLFCL